MTLNLEAFGDSPKKSNNKYKAALGVGSVLGLFGIGSTLAANISLNGGGNVEFGQGVATTAACDEDGFSITPVTSYDNDHSMFRVDSVQINGVDLTPEGSLNNTQLSYVDLGITDKNADSSIDQTDAKLQYPGQYYDGADWKRTCDNVVLDFSSYTDNPAYGKYTKDSYDNARWSSTDTTTPLLWTQEFFSNSSNLYYAETPNIAVAYDVTDDGNSVDSNYALGPNGYADYWGRIGLGTNGDLAPADVDANGADSSFSFHFSYTYRPNAAAISKITVASQKYFQEDYSDMLRSYSGPGTPRW